MENFQTIDHIRLSADERSVIILDQTLLPNEVKYITLETPEQMYEAVKALQVRGAPALGIFAGFALYALANSRGGSASDIRKCVRASAEYLSSSRPTAVNLSWAAGRMAGVCEKNPDAAAPELLSLLRRECQDILDGDIAMCTAISENGLALLHDGDGILTHCNAGPIATSRYGTAIGPMLLGRERGMNFHVFADETRPLLQGARLTSWELHNAGVDVTLICDNMASSLMKTGQVKFCFVGCDRVAANGDAANKIGTSGVAILARHYGIPFYVLGPSSTVDMSTLTGDDIKIELRDPEEIKTMWYKKPMAPAGVKCWNPSFDVTDHELIAGIITERGICRPPYTDSLAALFK